jgi:hypothetical protein
LPVVEERSNGKAAKGKAGGKAGRKTGGKAGGKPKKTAKVSGLCGSVTFIVDWIFLFSLLC